MCDYLKLQGAMEYLMTYGWSILILAVVLISLVYLGVFNSTQLGLKAPAGACKVERLQGVTSLEGLCQGIEPQFVLHITQNSGESETYTSEGGANPGLLVNLMNAPQMVSCVGCANALGSLTISFWYMNYTPSNNGDPFVSYLDRSMLYQFGYIVSDLNPGYISSYFWGYTPTDSYYESYTLPPPPAPWYFGDSASLTNYNTGTQKFVFYTLTFTPNTISNPTSYTLNVSVFSQGSLSSNSIGETSLAYPGQVYFPGGTAELDIGQYLNGGYLSNLQVYNTSLSKAQLTYLYDQGIGGAPTDINNLIAWYPLNGNTNDYSGNNNPIGIIGDASYSSTYDSFYQKP